MVKIYYARYFSFFSTTKMVPFLTHMCPVIRSDLSCTGQVIRTIKRSVSFLLGVGGGEEGRQQKRQLQSKIFQLTPKKPSYFSNIFDCL